jgi:hypothetical protein
MGTLIVLTETVPAYSFLFKTSLSLREETRHELKLTAARKKIKLSFILDNVLFIIW